MNRENRVSVISYTHTGQHSSYLDQLVLPTCGRLIESLLQHWIWGGLVIPHQWFVMACTFEGMSPVPAGATVVAETLQVTAEEGSLLNVAGTAE